MIVFSIIQGARVLPRLPSATQQHWSEQIVPASGQGPHAPVRSRRATHAKRSSCCTHFSCLNSMKLAGVPPKAIQGAPCSSQAESLRHHRTRMSTLRPLLTLQSASKLSKRRQEVVISAPLAERLLA